MWDSSALNTGNDWGVVSAPYTGFCQNQLRYGNEGETIEAGLLSQSQLMRTPEELSRK